MLSNDTVKSTVVETIHRIAKRKQPDLAAVDSEHHLIRDLGFDSLDVAELIAALELTLSIDPFSSSPTLTLAQCMSVRALCAAYAP